MSDIDFEQLKKLREPFPDNLISKLPKETKQQAAQRKADQEKGNWPPKCNVCEGYHHPKAVHLDYVGHAALTDRLLDVDPLWSWEPMATDAAGLPALDRNGNMWIRLTVCGVTRLGYGAADGKTGGDAIKEQIGDALRNAAMRFGAALDLWHKGDLHAHHEEDDTPSAADRFYVDAEAALKAAVSVDQLRAVFINRTNAEAKQLLSAEQIDGLTKVKDAKKAELEQAAKQKDAA